MALCRFGKAFVDVVELAPFLSDAVVEPQAMLTRFGGPVAICCGQLADVLVRRCDTVAMNEMVSKMKKENRCVTRS